MIHGSKVQFNCSLFFIIKIHYCFHCKTRLKRKKREKVVNSESDEAKKYDFSMLDTFLHGNIKFITYYYECPKCNAIYEINELKKLERG